MEYPYPAASASIWRQERLSAMTHVHQQHGHNGHESTDLTHLMWSIASVGCEPGPSTSARTRTWAEVNVRPRPSLMGAGEKTKTSARQDHTVVVHVCCQRNIYNQRALATCICNGWRGCRCTCAQTCKTKHLKRGPK